MKPLILGLAALLALAAPWVGAQEDAKPQVQKPAATHRNVKPAEFEKLSKADQKNTVILDVRTKEENEAAKIPGSVLLDIASDDFDRELAKLDPSKTYLVYCAGGGRGSRACRKMAPLGLTNLYNLEGGIQAWQKEGKPVEKKK